MFSTSLFLFKNGNFSKLLSILGQKITLFEWLSNLILKAINKTIAYS